MKKSYLLFFLFFTFCNQLKAQQEEVAVKVVIQRLFDGMRAGDSVAILSVFTPKAIMQTITIDKEGKTTIQEDAVTNFVSSIGRLPKGAAFNGKFSHCGVNSFTLVKLNGEWKINYVIDTRRKQNCN
ncbi:MAG: hypothetical protein EB101_10490 [Chitinophagia bacterium]|nr:hypothetical protein [Chitinophagia bacterium]